MTNTPDTNSPTPKQGVPMTREELLKRIEQVIWAVYSKEEEQPSPVAYRMRLVSDLLDEYEQPTHKKINGVDGYLGEDIPHE